MADSSTWILVRVDILGYLFNKAITGVTAEIAPVEEILNEVLSNNNQEKEIEKLEELKSNLLPFITIAKQLSYITK